jgi:hypothetical protein
MRARSGDGSVCGSTRRGGFRFGLPETHRPRASGDRSRKSLNKGLGPSMASPSTTASVPREERSRKASSLSIYAIVSSCRASGSTKFIAM